MGPIRGVVSSAVNLDLAEHELLALFLFFLVPHGALKPVHCDGQPQVMIRKLHENVTTRYNRTMFIFQRRSLPRIPDHVTQLVVMTWLDRPPVPDRTAYRPQRSAAVTLRCQPSGHLRQLVFLAHCFAAFTIAVTAVLTASDSLGQELMIWFRSGSFGVEMGLTAPDSTRLPNFDFDKSFVLQLFTLLRSSPISPISFRNRVCQTLK